MSSIPGVEWSPSNFDLQRSLSFSLRLGNSPLFGYFVGLDEKNPAINVLSVRERLHPDQLCV